MLFFAFLLISYLFLFIFSYLWVDFNLSLTHYPFLVNFLDKFQHWGYFNRFLSAKIYLGLLIILFGSQLYLLFSNFLQKQSLKKLLVLAGIVVLLGSLSYPFLSHDIFNYLFDAKIIWHYRQNPYLRTPQSFSGDHWLRFMHWVHRTCLYGPIWLLYTLIPGLLSFGKFVINFYGLKLLNGLLFFSTGWLLLKINKNNKRVFTYWFFNPFLLIELLINSHNDLLMIALAVMGFYFWQKKKKWGWLFFLFSVASKYVSVLLLPAFILKKHYKLILLGLALILLIGFIIKIESFQSWYFAWLFMLLPFLKLSPRSWMFFLAGELLILLVKYYPFLRLGQWQTTGYLYLQGFFVLLALILAFDFFKIRLRKVDRDRV